MKLQLYAYIIFYLLVPSIVVAQDSIPLNINQSIESEDVKESKFEISIGTIINFSTERTNVWTGIERNLMKYGASYVNIFNPQLGFSYLLKNGSIGVNLMYSNNNESENNTDGSSTTSYREAGFSFKNYRVGFNYLHYFQNDEFHPIVGLTLLYNGSNYNYYYNYNDFGNGWTPDDIEYSYSIDKLYQSASVQITGLLGYKLKVSNRLNINFLANFDLVAFTKGFRRVSSTYRGRWWNYQTHLETAGFPGYAVSPDVVEDKIFIEEEFKGTFVPLSWNMEYNPAFSLSLNYKF